LRCGASHTLAILAASFLAAGAPAHQACAQTAAPGATPTLRIVYLGLDRKLPAPSASLAPPTIDDALQGAKLGVSDDATTGKFLQQGFALIPTVSPNGDALLAAFQADLAAGDRLFVVDAPAPLLLAMAGSKGAAEALILDATSRDDALRGPDCRPNMLHLLPDRAMLADALMQYLVTKDWTRIMLLRGKSTDDTLFADAVRQSATKYQIDLVTVRDWTFNAAAQQADTGHYEVNAEVDKATQGANYDVLVVADEAGAFGDQLAYRTDRPRPVAGTQGLVPSAWSPVMDEYASTELQLRFRRATGRDMNDAAYGAWLATRALGEAATRTGKLDPATIMAYLRGPDFALSGYKGPPLSFRPWDGQLRQPILLADTVSLVSISPQPGFLHQTNDLDTLGADQPETTCHMH
jgi:ABC transporter substrate binding protein (PQQ-dependent alcohol dehydrogenase system)